MRRTRRLQQQPASLQEMCVVSWSECIALLERRRVALTTHLSHPAPPASSVKKKSSSRGWLQVLVRCAHFKNKIRLCEIIGPLLSEILGHNNISCDIKMPRHILVDSYEPL